MLVLSRRPSERVLLKIGDIEIAVTLVRVNEYGARLGFEAPKNVTILRDEVPDDSAIRDPVPPLRESLLAKRKRANADQ